MNAPAPTDPTHWQRVNLLLAEALSLPQPEREQWLAGLRANDQPFVATLRSLLARSAVETDTFMHRPVSRRLLEAVESESRADRPGVDVGPYRLIRQVGAGGMGTVWLAERSDGKLQRRVAIKLPRSGWALGVAERLEQERDLLAALEHPNIARLYDAGTAAGGRPYIAMEFVDGVPIDEYVRTRDLPVEQRLRLFLDIAGAVAYAHARLIVHRDLKPSNILVTHTGEARLLDFGAAKLLRDEPVSALTRQVGQAMSPDYAAPEQIRTEGITVATDVYSLGVVLYELLTGQLPYRLRGESRAALEESIATVNVATASSRVASNRPLARALRGNLDTILAKALQRDADRRYRSVEAFADDVARHLAGEPVLARPDSAGYRMRKFVQRHLGAVIAASLVVCAVGAGSAVALWQANVARVEAARAERVKAFIASIFTQAVPRAGVGGVVTASDLLTAATTRLNTELAGDPAVSAELGIIIADSFDRLGEPGKSVELLQKSVADAERSFGRTDPLTLRGKLRMANETRLRDIDAALAIVDDALPDLLAGLPQTAQLTVEALEEKSFILAKLEKADESYAALEQGIAIGEKHLGPMAEQVIWDIGLLSNTYARFSQRALQLTTATEALRRAQLVFAPKRPHNTLISVERWYAEALRANNRPADAIPILERVLHDQQQLDAAVTVRVRNARYQLAVAHLTMGRVVESLPMFRDVMAIQESQEGVEADDRIAYGAMNLTALTVARQIDAGLAEYDRVGSIAREAGFEAPRYALGREARRAQLLALRGSWTDAARVAAEVIESTKAESGAPERLVWAQAILTAALNARLQGRPADALEILRPLDRAAGSLQPAIASNLAAEMASNLLDLGNSEQAEIQVTRCGNLFAQAQIVPSVVVPSCLISSARRALSKGDGKAAEQFMLPLVKGWEEINPASPWHGEALYWLARAQDLQGRELEARSNTTLARAMLADTTLPALRELL